MTRSVALAKKKRSTKKTTKPQPKPKEEPSGDDLLKQGVERAKRGLRGEDPDLRKKP